ncbi:MAG: hypothetical protein FJW27_18860 [Acidimicrobiia bacterium]|nr:hypothetical protein [Acidimicrobiia bacterium]
MDVSYRHIDDLLGQVRSRWRRLLLLRATVVAALAVAAVIAAGLAVGDGTSRSSHALAAVGLVTSVLAVAVAIRALAPVRLAPNDRQIARFIEERDETLDDRLVSAVDVVSARADRPDGPAPALAAAVIADAGRRAASVEPGSIIASDLLRRGALRALAALVVMVAVGFSGRHAARRSFDALSLSLFPARVQLNVVPGDARVQAGSTVTIEARLVGNTAPVAAQLQRVDGEGWLSTDMSSDKDGTFRAQFDALGESFRYRVVAGAIESDVYEIAVVRPPRVTRVDVEYRYPAALGLEARTEEDTGDIYAPAGTDVRLIVHTDRDAASGHLALGGGTTLRLSASTPTRLEASMRIERDDSYRVRVADRDGMSAPGETEYFIRMLDDRPPDVRVLRPARDRSVTALDEVDIQAEAQDDFGIASLELVYTVRGAAEKVVPFEVPKRTPVVTGDLTLFLEDLKVQPGDFLSYYVRARDLPRGRRSSEARSDMFFLEVKPFEQEFTLARSQGGGGSPQIDDLVNAQKEVIVATWKLDRRALASGASSEEEIRTVAKAEAELKARVVATASQFRDSAMRDPRRRGATPGAPRAGQTLPEEDAMTAASKAMGVAVMALEKLQTKTAMPPELEALNHLLRAQADVRQREVTRQTGAGGAGQNRQTQDLSSLFDKELARQQQTNYETPNSAEQKPETEEDNLLDKIRELAKRQDELLRRQEEVANQRQQLSAEQMKRALEKLTRDQERLREQAEQIARELSRGQPSGAPKEDRSGQRSASDAKRPSGEQAQSGQQQRSGGQQSQGSQQAGGSGQSGHDGQSGQSRPGEGNGRTGDRGSRMREVSEDMRNAASELSRQDPTQASARANRALDKLRELERQLQAGRPDEQRRAIGDLQLEARQLADAQRQLSSELGRVGQGETGRDALRRLAGEQARLAERAGRLQQNVERQANAAGSDQAGRGGSRAAAAEQSANAQRALGEAAKDMQRQRLTERMQQSAEQIREATRASTPQENAAQGRSSPPQGSSDTRSPQQTARTAASGQGEIARAFDRLADRLAAATGPSDEASRKLTDQLARAQELREDMARLSGELERLGDQPGPQGTSPGGQHAAGRSQDGKPSPSNRDSADGRGGGQSGSGEAAGLGSGGDGERLRDEYTRQLKAAKELLDELQRDNRTSGQGGYGFTFEGQGMVLSAPGTQAFKQDFAQWKQLRRQATQLLEQAESSLSKRLQARSTKERLASGLDDQPPASYSQQVDSYFKALAAKKGR